MSVYNKENKDWFQKSLESILNNTVVPTQIVVVKDGLLTEELNSIIDKYSKNPLFTIVGYENNRGLGYALNYGLAFCRYGLIARMDSDDVCSHNRFEKELTAFVNDPSLSIVGSNISEFIDHTNNVISIRIVPEKHEDIIKYSQTRNPFNHPSVMFRKNDIMAVGGYRDFYRHEDYYLWYRLLSNNYKALNIQESLVYMRISNDFYKRRGGVKAYKYRNKLNRLMLTDKYISFGKFIFVWFLNFGNLVTPSFLRRFIHLKMLRKKAN